jgi:putative membrane protein
MSEESEKRPVAFTSDIKGKSSGELEALYTSQRTGLAFQRTRLSADRTLMSVIRTSLALIGFGFTVFQFFQHIRQTHPNLPPNTAVRNFSLCLVALGVLMLILGIIYQINFMLQIRKERNAFIAERLLPAMDSYPLSMTLLVAALLFVLGFIAIVTMMLQVHPDG